MKLGFKTLAASTLCLATLCAAQSRADEAKAGFFIEPGVTYEMGKTSIDYPSPLSNSSGEANGLGLVLRGGIHVGEVLFLGLDGRYGRLNFKDSTNDLSSDANMYSFAPVIGAQMPDLGGRVWAGYIVNSQLDPAEAGQFDFKFKDGKGFLIGAGFRVSAVSLNLEYKDVRYPTTEFEKAGPISGSTSFEARDKAWIGSVTFPIEL